MLKCEVLFRKCLSQHYTLTVHVKTMQIKVLCEQTREANKQIKMSFGLCLILFGFGNVVADFHVLVRV